MSNVKQERITFYLRRDLRDKLERISDKQEKTLGKVVREMIKQSLPDKEVEIQNQQSNLDDVGGLKNPRPPK